MHGLAGVGANHRAAAGHPLSAELFARFLSDPDDAMRRTVYADWLEEQGDRRAEFIRAQGAVRATEPDDPSRLALEATLSRARVGLELEWLAKVEPERAHLASSSQPSCHCLQKRHRGLRLHGEPQDTECDAWRKLVDVIEQASIDQPREFDPLVTLTAEERLRIVTLPPNIAKLKSVHRLLLYGSSLVRIPHELGEMTSLQQFVPYRSYRLHWFPYEITRSGYWQSTVSTRALFGNYKFRPQFPDLTSSKPSSVPRSCSLCRAAFVDTGAHRVWHSMQVGRDVLPLLVNACSAECLKRLPAGAKNHLLKPHRGGEHVSQPPTSA